MALMLRTILGFAFLFLMMAAALFLPAGSTRFWQAWIYLAVFSGCSILITVYLAIRDKELLAGRVYAGPAAESRPSQRIIQGLASLLFIAILVVPGLDFHFSWSHVPAALSLVADLVAVLCFLVIFLTFRENRFSRGTIAVSAGQKVIATGPYVVVRHPLYAGALLLLLVTPIALGSWVGLALFVPFIAVIVVRIRDEEALLRAKLDGYVAYRAKVRYRVMPFVW